MMQHIVLVHQQQLIRVLVSLRDIFRYDIVKYEAILVIHSLL